MNGTDNNKYCSMRPPWKQPKYDRYKKSHKTLLMLKDTYITSSQGVLAKYL